MRPRAFDHVVLNVGDVERAIAWYTGELGLRPERVEEWRAGEAPFPSVRVSADTVIDLVAAPRSGENVNHICLAFDGADLEEVAASGRFDVVEGPGLRWGARGTATAIYVRDPDGNTVELRAYGHEPGS